MRSLICSVIFMLILAVLAPNQPLAASISAESAILMEQSSGRILFARKEHEPMRIASITKIMTAILAIESGKMTENVTISKRAVGVEGSSLFLQLGEKLTLEDLVYGLMLRSGNDGAVAIAEHVGGSVEGFVFMMNEKARELGMNNTIFSNPHGLDDHENHYSTAYDMALLTQYAMKNEHYQIISATKEYRSKRSDGASRYWLNKNRLLTQLYSHSTGGKTGFTKRAKRTLVSTAKKDDMELICVTLNAPSDWHDHINLFESAFQNYTLTTLANEGVVKGMTDPFYQNKLVIPNDFYYPLKENEINKLEKAITLYRPPNEEEARVIRQPVGKISFTLEGKLIKEMPLYFLENEQAEKKSFWTKFIQFFTNKG